MKKRTYTDKPLGDTEWLLEQWGSWRMDGMGVPRYVSPSYASAATAGPCEYTLTDDMALVIDGAVARLTKRDQVMGDFVWLYYAAKRPAHWVGTAAGVSERKAFEIIKAGVAWVDSALEHIREAA